MSNIIDFNQKKKEILSRRKTENISKPSHDSVDKKDEVVINFLNSLSSQNEDKMKEEERQKTINAFIEILKKPIVFD